jgi:hypothetical protein
MSVKTRVRGTSETVVVDTKIQDQGHRTHHVHKVNSQLNIPTIPTPVFSYVTCFDRMCCVEEVRNILFDTRMSGTSTQVVTQRVHLELPSTTTR